MVWKCVHGVTPAYLSDLCVPATAISGRQHLRSAATGTLLVPRARTATGQRSFAVNGPATWNRLPPALRSPDLSESAFKQALKTHLFSSLDRPAPLTRFHDSGAGYKYPDLLTYLLTADAASKRQLCQRDAGADRFTIRCTSLYRPTHWKLHGDTKYTLYSLVQTKIQNKIQISRYFKVKF